MAAATHRQLRPARGCWASRAASSRSCDASTPPEDPGLSQRHPDQPRDRRRETILSVREVLRQRRAHCIEGAFVAACRAVDHGEPPLVMDMECDPSDYGHVIALFRRGAKWGGSPRPTAAYLRYRDPVYRSLRELSDVVFPRILQQARPQDAAQLFGGVRYAAHRSRAVGDEQHRSAASDRRSLECAEALPKAHLQAAGAAAFTP